MTNTCQEFQVKLLLDLLSYSRILTCYEISAKKINVVDEHFAFSYWMNITQIWGIVKLCQAKKKKKNYIFNAIVAFLLYKYYLTLFNYY